MRFWSVLLVSIVAFVVLATLAAREDGATYDEGPFLEYGLLHLRGQVERTQALNSKLPVTALHAIPVALDGRPALLPLPDGSSRPLDRALLRARAPGILLGAVLVLAMGLGARSV